MSSVEFRKCFMQFMMFQKLGSSKLASFVEISFEHTLTKRISCKNLIKTYLMTDYKIIMFLTSTLRT